MRHLNRCFVVLIFFFLFNGLSGCGSDGQPETESEDLTGEQLARIHCGSCHQFPDPTRLDGETWRAGVLPRMARYMGLKDSRFVQKVAMQEALDMQQSGAFPLQPAIDSAGWKKIAAYYLNNAPDSLEVPVWSRTGAAGFVSRPLSLGGDGGALTSLLKWVPERQLLYVGDARHQLIIADSRGAVIDQAQFDSPPVAIHADERGGTYVLDVGIIHPDNRSLGGLSYLTPEGEIQRLLSELPRPVDMAFADLDMDGREDIVICGFGHYTGRLSWFRNLGAQQYEEHVLVDAPGALKTYVLDFDGNGLKDILTLMAQGDERILIHYNRGDGYFEEQTLLRFDPVFGSAYFEPVDYDEDGDLDLLYLNGDNADFSQVLKPYHGIRLYENGPAGFSESLFLPLPGAYKAFLNDFDRDGDQDIAAISFFPDYQRQPETGFVFFENRTSGEDDVPRFNRLLIEEATLGRWLTMDCADVDANGTPDLLLGSFTFSPSPAPADLRRIWQEKSLNVLLLLNAN